MPEVKINRNSVPYSDEECKEIEAHCLEYNWNVQKVLQKIKDGIEADASKTVLSELVQFATSDHSDLIWVAPNLGSGGISMAGDKPDA